jgi:hypothetical protein
MNRQSRWAIIAAAVLTGACYHVTVETGLPASTTVIQRDWAHSFIAGLVPPSTEETKAKCPNGVAKVETQMSLPNMVASFVTSGIYTPMTITVTCASSNRMASLPTGASMLHVDASTSGASTVLMQKAFELAAKTGEPVFVDLR